MRITDCMPVRDNHPHLVRSVEGISGTVDMRMELAVRFDYGQVVPWVTRQDGLTRLTAGPDSVALWHRVEAKGQDLRTVADFTVTRAPALSLHAGLAPLPRGSAAAAGQLLRRPSDRGLLDGVGRRLLLRGSVP